MKTLNKVIDKIAKFNWSRLVPTVKHTKNPDFALGIEPTWGYSGPGIGIGLGSSDFWIGWPPSTAA